MTRSDIVIGIDLDNTLVCYDGLFHLAACEERLIDPSTPKSKETIRDAIRCLPNGESQWTRLQAMVYGQRMSAASLFEGSDVFLRQCARSGTRPRIISHRTPFALLDGNPVDLRQPAREWLEAKGFFSEFGFSPQDIYFESTRAEKIDRIRSLGCTHFIDDLAEVFAESAFPRDTAKLLFSPQGAACIGPDTRVFKRWRELAGFLFNDPRD